ncbi:hypothetical protein CCMA1212_002060 [Trichoderma ghanense]|uniref:Uncharacterized protein n=1 Tax=Trichoderma ghanense TaxID=65468 RepID=A0ABY2HBL7_9HYPO
MSSLLSQMIQINNESSALFKYKYEHSEGESSPRPRGTCSATTFSTSPPRRLFAILTFRQMDVQVSDITNSGDLRATPSWDLRSRDLCSSSNTTLPLLRTTTEYLLLPNVSFSPRFQLQARPARQTTVPKQSAGVDDPGRSPLAAHRKCYDQLQESTTGLSTPS